MTDFKAVARARGLDIPDAELDRIVPTLEALEAAFRPLAANLSPLLEPATGFCPLEEEAE
jgi:hypothetical protein